MRNTYLLIIIALSAFLFVFNSCGTESTPIYNLTTSVNGEGSVSPSSGEFEEGETVTITGTPNEGWIFSRWEGDWSSTENSSSITMNSDKTITAVFERKDYPLTITIEGEGEVQEEIISSPKSTEYPYETVVQLTPVPSENYEFVEWGGDLSGSETPKHIVVDDTKNVTAKFRHVLEGRTLQQINGSRVTESNYSDGGTYSSSFTYDFDTNENVTNYVSYNTDGSISRRTTYTYDSNDNLTERIQTRYNSDGSNSFKTTYTYDSNNNRIELTDYNSDGSVSSRTTYTYDSNDNLTERINYGSDGSVSSRFTYTYDSNNNLTELIYYGSDGSVSSRFTYTYDSNNNLTELINYDSDGTVSWKTTYTYDSDNNMIKSVGNFDDSSNWTTEYEYDFNGNQTKYYDVYNFRVNNSWYKTTTTENRDNIYYERGMKISNQNTSTQKSKNHQLIWEFDRLNRNTDELQSPNRDMMERLDRDFLPTPDLHHFNDIY